MSCPSGKKAYRDSVLATRHRDRIRDTRPGARIYLCRHCKRWHVTSHGGEE